jgi:ribose transport system ATP-binding protein
MMRDNLQIPALSVSDLSKRFGGTQALMDASIDFVAGEIHALVGENGAGKSTLCKILSGAQPPDSGEMFINGKSFDKFTILEAHKQGISMVYQEFNLIPDMPIYENMFVGKEIRKGLHVDRKAMIERTNEVFSSLDIIIDPLLKISDISVAYCQLVEIGKAVLEEKKILILDEPTAPLTEKEVSMLFRLVKRLKDEGITIIYISHRMEEIFELSDRVTIMRDGAVIVTLPTRDTTQAEIIKHMIGRDESKEFPQKATFSGNRETVLRVKEIRNEKLNGVSFELMKGEILGIAGLVGSGRTETVRALFGADDLSGGEVFIKGEKTEIKNPTDAIRYGIGLIPEDRKRQGLHLELAIRNNISLIELPSLSKGLVVSVKREKKMAEKYINLLSIKLASQLLPVNSLSGGNQQKVVLAKWLSTNAEILIFDEPTRGIDVGAKMEIYNLLNKLREQGKAIIMISSEMQELVGMCDRVLVLYEGTMQGELSKEEISQTRIMELASGLYKTSDNI